MKVNAASGPTGRLLVHRYAGLGDALFVNTVAYHLGREQGRRVWIGSNYPELFRGNPYVRALPVRRRKWGMRAARLLTGCGLIAQAHYMMYTEAGAQPKEHILAVLARQVGLTAVPERPLLFLQPDEIARMRLAPEREGWVAIQSAGVASWTPNKEWYPERFARVADALRSRYAVVQLGLPTDPSVPADLDLRGKVSPREAAAVLSHCSLFVGQVGFLMHAAAAVHTRSVILYGGFEAPWQSGYAWNENLFTDLPCSPCWLDEPCPYHRKCMDEISVERVTVAAERILSETPVSSQPVASLYTPA